MKNSIELLTGYEELLNHAVLGANSSMVATGTSQCCASGTCALPAY